MTPKPLSYRQRRQAQLGMTLEAYAKQRKERENNLVDWIMRVHGKSEADARAYVKQHNLVPRRNMSQKTIDKILEKLGDRGGYGPDMELDYDTYEHIYEGGSPRHR